MLACRRCNVLSDTVREVKPGLALCPACPLFPDCGEWQHIYHGGPPGGWVCLRCGLVMHSQKIVVETPAPSGDVALRTIF